MTPERMLELATGLGAAKNRQDVSAALAFMNDDIELTSPAWERRSPPSRAFPSPACGRTFSARRRSRQQNEEGEK